MIPAVVSCSHPQAPRCSYQEQDIPWDALFFAPLGDLGPGPGAGAKKARESVDISFLFLDTGRGDMV